MFTVPEQYVDNKKMELMLKELSSLFYRVCKFYTNGNYNYDISIKEFSFLMSQHPEKKWINCEVFVESIKFKLKFMVSKDGFVYKDCVSFLDEKECTQEDIINLVEKTNLLELLRKKITSIKESFITGKI